MKRNYLHILFYLVIVSSIAAQDTFYKNYQFALEGDDERARYLYNIDDTLRLITIRSVSTVGINFSMIDTNGEVISNIYHDDIYFFQDAMVYDEGKEEFIFDGISRRDLPYKNCIVRFDKYGNLIDITAKEYGLPDGGGVDNIFHMVKTDFGYASSGLEFSNDNQYGLLNIYDDDLNLTFSDTLSQFRNISNISYDGQGGINGIGLVRNNLFLPTTIDSMFFLKINNTGDIIKQVRIPHTEGVLQQRGVFPFITDTLTRHSYLLYKYKYSPVSSALPRLLKFDQMGNVIWDFHDWKTWPRLSSLNLFLRKNGDIIAHGAGNHFDVTTNGSSDPVLLVSIDSEGNFLWDKIFYELVTLDEEIDKKFLYSRYLSNAKKINRTTKLQFDKTNPGSVY